MDRPVGSRYLLEQELGRGASGTVWRAHARDTGESVAVKVLREDLADDPDVVTRFMRERSLLLRLRHPNLVRVRDMVVEGSLLALVMDLIDGPDLRTYLYDNGPLPPVPAALTMAQVCDALRVTHADGVIHRDLKPANIMLNRNGDALYPMLTDFGIARLADSPALTRTHELVGTPSYVAPEAAEGRPLTPAVDVYAAGIVLYELVAGHTPFREDNAMAVLHRHLTETPARPPGMPDPYWLVVERCLAKQPERRPDATALARALRTAADVISGARPDDGALRRLLDESAAAAAATSVLSPVAPPAPSAPPPPPLPPPPNRTRVMEAPVGYPPQPPTAAPVAPEPRPPASPRRDADPYERAPREREPRRERDRDRDTDRRDREPRRGRRFRLSSIPGVGCTMGCLLRLVILAAVLAAIYWLTPVHDWVHSTIHAFDTVKGWYNEVKNFVSGGGGGDNSSGDSGGGG